MAVLLHDPNEELDYTFNWDSRLGGATIEDSSWSIVPEGPVVAIHEFTDTSATVFVSGLEDGEVYRLINEITTSRGTTERDEATIRCQKR